MVGVAALLLLFSLAPSYAAALPPPPPPKPSAPIPGEIATLDDHPFDAAWLAGEVARLGGEVTAVVPPDGPHPPAPDQFLGELLRNRVDAFELGALDRPASERERVKVVWMRERDNSEAATYYSGQGFAEVRGGWPRHVHYVFLAVCAHASPEQQEPPCRAVLQPGQLAATQAWVGVAFSRTSLADLYTMLRYAAELVAARDTKDSPPWLAPQPDAWDGLDQVVEVLSEGKGAPGPGEVADERDHPFSSTWLGAELQQREAAVIKAVRAPGERVGAPEGALFAYAWAKLAGQPAAVRDGLLEFSDRRLPFLPSLIWYGSRAWVARGGSQVAYRFVAQCRYDIAGQRLKKLCDADVYLEVPDTWLRVWVPSERRAEMGTIVHYAAEAAVAAEAESRPMRGLLDRHP